jgi:transcription elongation factor GreA
MAEKKTELTPEGVRKLEDELNHLKLTKRKEVAEKLKEARGLGDLSENAEYDSAKEEQGYVENRIAVLEKMLRNVVVISPAEYGDEVGFGSKFRLKYIDESDEIEEDYIIVGSAEADPFADPLRISNESPLGSALLGKKLNESVTVDVPGGVSITYTVISVN